jgi:hypothetical protein
MLGMETVAERMADYFVRHNPTMPGSGKAAQAVDAARCLEDSEHASMMTNVPRPGKTTAAPRVRGDSGRVTRNSRTFAGINFRTNCRPTRRNGAWRYYFA